MNFVKDLWSSRELLGNLILREVRGQYKRTIFGRLWSLANPLAAMVIYTFVFYFIFRVTPDVGDPSGINIFAIWLLCGLLPWTFFSSALTNGMGSLVNNAGLITKVHFARGVLPLAAIGVSGTNWLFEMGVLLVALVIVGGFGVLLWLPATVLGMVLLALFAAGLSLVLAIANVHFRDTQYLLTIVLQVWMYLTPIVYPVKLVEAQSEIVGPLLGTPLRIIDIYQWNPMFHFVEIFRQSLYDQRWPDGVHLLVGAAWALVAMTLGSWFFQRNEKKIAELL